MGTGAPSNSNRTKNPTEERKKRKKAARKTSRSSKRRRRQDSPSPSSRSDYSSPPASSSDSEDDAIPGVSRGRSSKKDAPVGRQRLPSRGGGSSRRQKKGKKASYQGEKEAKRRDSRSKLGKGSNQRRGRDRRRRRRRSSSRGTSVGSPDTYSSRSCSTCRSRSSSPESTRSAGRSLRSKGKIVKASSTTRGRSSSRKEKQRSGRRPSDGEYRHRSPSCSSCSYEGRSRSQTRGRRGRSDFRDDEGRLAEKSDSRNLLTTSTLVKHSDKMEHGYGSGQDAYEAEIIQDFDDLHTSRSNDSYESERKRESGMSPLSPLQHAPERRRHDDSSRFMGGNGHADKAEAVLKREISSSVVVTEPHDGAQWGNGNVSPAPRYAEPRLKSQVSTSGGGSEADDLELLLRQKALENFKKFRARNSTNANSVREDKYQSIPIKAHEVTTGKSEPAQVHESGRPITVPAKQKSYTSLEHHTPANDGSQLLQFESISDANVPAQACSLVEKRERNDKKLMQQHPEFQAELSEEICLEDMSSKNMSAKKNSANGGDTDIHREEGSRVDVSASTDISCHRSASEFEQKTMSVVHGGEVVQVSYKVYIPKRTPALARRRLQQ